MQTRIAIISNSVTPYRIHLHRRIVQECPDLELWSIFTHQFSNAPWQLGVPDEIRPVFFGDGEASEQQGFATAPLHELRKGRRIARLLTEHAIQFVILFGYNDWCRLYLIRWCRSHNIPCFIFGDSNARADSKQGGGMRVKSVILPRILSMASGAMHCGRVGAEYFRSYRVPEDRLFAFPYEPDYNLVAGVSPSRRDRALGALQLAPGRRRILYAGRLAAVKRVDLLLSAFQRIADERSEWDLVIAGDGVTRPELLKQVESRLEHRIRFLGFINDPEELAALYAACDILVLPSDFEPWGVVVTEAATRLALICSSQVGAAYDLVEDHRNGRMFRSGDSDQLAEALCEVSSPGNIDRMKSESPLVLAAWRSRTDPVVGLRRAMHSVGVPWPGTWQPN